MNAWYEYIIKKKKVMMRHKDLQNPAIYWIDGVTVLYYTVPPVLRGLFKNLISLIMDLE